MFLPEKKRLSVFLCHAAETVEHKQQVLVQFSWRCGHYDFPQKVWIVVLYCLAAAFIRSLLQDPIGVDNKFHEGRVKCCFIAKLVELLHEVSVPLSEIQPIAFIYPPCQRVCANLQGWKK